MKTCPTCGGLVPLSIVGRKRVYCSKQCQERRPNVRKSAPKPRSCSVCGEPFVPLPHMAKRQHRCSPDCGKQRPSCRHCGTPVGKGKRMYCGVDCAKRAKAERMSEFMRIVRMEEGERGDRYREYQRQNHLRRRERYGHWRKLYPERAARTDALRRARMQAVTVEAFTPTDVYERDGWACQLCHQPIDPAVSWPDPASPSIDHVVPLSRGGHHVLANVQASHLGCNSRKCDRINDDQAGAVVASSA